MNTHKTLYISDLDGTLLNHSAELSEYTKRALNTMIANGLHFTVSTARTLVSASKILADLALRVPIALMNGALIYDMEQQRYSRIHTFPPEVAQAVIRTLRAFKATGFMYEMNGGELATYHESHEQHPLRNFVKKRIARYYQSFQHTDGFPGAPPENAIYFTLQDTLERLSPVHETISALPGLNLVLYKDNYSRKMWYLEIYSAEASKQNAAIYLREAFGYTRIVGFGDNLNDLPMFAACDIRIAVGNAKPEVKAAADHICGTNDKNGVVKWLEENHRDSKPNITDPDGLMPGHLAR